MKIKHKLKELSIEYLDLYPYRRYMTKNKCIFVHIPKAAGTSVLQALAGHSGHIQRDHFTIHDCISASRKRYNEYFKFTIVREPIDRIRSVYQYLSNGGNKRTDLPLAKKINDEFKDFNEFVIGFLNHESIHSLKLTKPQYTFLCDENYNVLVDFAGRYESLENDFNEVASIIGLEVRLPSANRSEPKSITISPDAEKKIRELYRKDYELFYSELIA